MNRRDRAAIFLRSLLLQAVWNFRTMQSLGLAFALDPWLVKLWRDKGELARARERHLGYFNTQPYMASYALGVICRQEEALSVSPAKLRAGAERRLGQLKGLLGPALAALGDSLFWGALRPALAVAAAGLFAVLRRRGVEGAWLWASAAYLLPYNGIALSIRWSGLKRGYADGERLVATLAALPIKRLVRGLHLAGTALAFGLLVAVFFDPGGPGPVPTVALAAATAGLLRAGLGIRTVYGGLLAAAACLAAAGVSLG